ncbi:dnaK protein [Histomonas meleagridis]|uniref:dnaK protein n=1 Tax=Histomonas meleagridis TaxID=135588 RepID=UPI00355AB889|nr:dnaK protein [Histomonas meleagridis]KAH0800336.1 dnaK protein [Histomonas meleagridis]
MVTYTNARRYSCEGSQHHQMEFFDSTITNLKRLIGLKYQDRAELEKAVPFTLVELPDGLTGISVNYHNKQITLRPEQCIGFLFRSILTQVIFNVPLLGSVSVSVPQYWNETKRRLLLFAASYMSKDVSLINSNTAAAIAYAVNNSNRLHPTNPINVLFIDIGHLSMSVSLTKITKTGVKVISHASDPTLGGSSFTSLFIDYLLQKVSEKYHGFDPRQHPRGMLRFRSAVEKAKKDLSVNKAVNFEVDPIMDVYINFVVKRDELDTAIAPLLTRIKAPIDECLSSAKINKSQIDVVQLLGGGARVVSVKQRISEIIGKDLSTSLNLDECVALGCSYYASIHKGTFAFDVQDVTPMDIITKWHLPQSGRATKSLLFRKFTPIPSMKSFNIDIAQDKTDVIVESNNEIIGTLYITKINNSNNNKCMVKASLDKNFILSFDINDKNNFKLEYKPIVNIDNETIEKCMDIERQMQRDDTEQEKIDETKNEFEAELYSFTSAVENELKDYCGDEEREKIQTEQKWFEDNEDQRHSLATYKRRRDELKKTKEKVEMRKKMFMRIDEKADQMIKRANHMMQVYDGNTKAEIEKRNKLWDAEEMIMEMKNADRKKDPPYNLDEIDEMIRALE